MPLDKSFPTWERTAFTCGTEAQANGRSYMTPDDRLDVALAYGELAWSDLDAAVRERAQQRFYEGVMTERAVAKKFNDE